MFCCHLNLYTGSDARMDHSDLQVTPTCSNQLFFQCIYAGCGPRESEDGGECIYNCAANEGNMLCRVEFEELSNNSPLGNLKGLCFKNKACFGTPKACVDCKLKCEGYIEGCSSPTSAPAPFLDKPPSTVLFPDKAPIKDSSTGIPVDETHCVRRATSSINSPCLVSTKIT